MADISVAERYVGLAWLLASQRDTMSASGSAPLGSLEQKPPNKL